MVTGKEIVAEGDGEGHLNVKGAVDEEDDKMRSRNDWRKPMDADEAPYNVLQVIIIDLLCVRACMCVCACTYTYTCACTCTYTCARVRIRVYVYVCTCAFAFACFGGAAA